MFRQGFKKYITIFGKDFCKAVDATDDGSGGDVVRGGFHFVDFNQLIKDGGSCWF